MGDVLKDLVGKSVKLILTEREVLRASGRTSIISNYEMDRSDPFTDSLITTLEKSGLSYRFLLPGRCSTTEMNYTRTTIAINEDGVIISAGIN